MSSSDSDFERPIVKKRQHKRSRTNQVVSDDGDSDSDFKCARAKKARPVARAKRVVDSSSSDDDDSPRQEGGDDDDSTSSSGNKRALHAESMHSSARENRGQQRKRHQVEQNQTANASSPRKKATSLQPHRARVSATQQRLHISEIFISGFKSYQEGTIIDLGHNSKFTVIAGPNGAGKSSVADAALFCFGASAADLRASSCKDFINDQTMASTSAVKQAEVAVHFSTGVPDGDFVVRRVVNLSGQSTFSMESSDKKERMTKKQLHAALLARGLDLSCAERCVVQQSKTIALASSTPIQLLHFCEKIIGTGHLEGEIEQVQSKINAAKLALHECHAKTSTFKSHRELLEPKVDAFRAFRANESTAEAERSLLASLQRILCGKQVARATAETAGAQSLVAELKENTAAAQDQYQQAKKVATKATKSLGKLKVALQGQIEESRQLKRASARSGVCQAKVAKELKEIRSKQKKCEKKRIWAEKNENQAEVKLLEVKQELQNLMTKQSRMMEQLEAGSKVQGGEQQAQRQRLNEELDRLEADGSEYKVLEGRVLDAKSSHVRGVDDQQSQLKVEEKAAKEAKVVATGAKVALLAAAQMALDVETEVQDCERHLASVTRPVAEKAKGTVREHTAMLEQMQHASRMQIDEQLRMTVHQQLQPSLSRDGR
jgi:chromosome segregation ATPase